jgi:hypothetical protein
MKELLRTNDTVLLSWLTAVLRAERIEPIVLDAYSAVMEGSISAIRRRLMVDDDDYARARRIIEDVGEGSRLT